MKKFSVMDERWFAKLDGMLAVPLEAFLSRTGLDSRTESFHVLGFREFRRRHGWLQAAILLGLCSAATVLAASLFACCSLINCLFYERPAGTCD